jgi:hypothetical protein
MLKFKEITREGKLQKLVEFHKLLDASQPTMQIFKNYLSYNFVEHYFSQLKKIKIENVLKSLIT